MTTKRKPGPYARNGTRSTQEKVCRKPDDTITISFDRFHCLRSIAEAVRQNDRIRAEKLVDALLKIEARDYQLMLRGETASAGDYCFCNMRDKPDLP